MAAHAATILHQILNRSYIAGVEDFRFLQDVTRALAAPGIDSTLGFEPHNTGTEFSATEAYHNLSQACERGDAAEVRKIAQAFFDAINPIHQHYASLEDFQENLRAYWRPKTAYANRRYSAFYKDNFDHASRGRGAPYTEKGKSRYEAIAAGKA